MYITRIAPSPTGMMHVGTARTALFNWLAARASGGRFYVRIDDTDATRNQPEMVQPIFEGLKWLGLRPDEVYYQSAHAERGQYREWADLLLKADLAYRAENGAVLLRGDDLIPATWHDSVAGDQAVNDEERKHITGLVLLRGDGSPTYHFASTVDDYEMGVNFIIRGDDHRVNTAKHLTLWTAMAAVCEPQGKRDFPKTAHVGLIHMNGKKMSKRDGAASLLDYRDEGIDPDAMFAFLIRLGWGPREDNKANSLLTRDRALELFLEGGKMKSKPANFDEVMLKAFDRKVKGAKEALA